MLHGPLLMVSVGKVKRVMECTLQYYAKEIIGIKGDTIRGGQKEKKRRRTGV